MTNAFVGKLAFILLLGTAATTTVMTTPANAKCLKNCAGEGLKVEQGAVRSLNKDASGGQEVDDSEMKRGHNLVSGKVNKHRRNSVLRARVHNLVSGKVKRTKKNGTK